MIPPTKAPISPNTIVSMSYSCITTLGLLAPSNTSEDYSNDSSCEKTYKREYYNVHVLPSLSSTYKEKHNNHYS